MTVHTGWEATRSINASDIRGAFRPRLDADVPPAASPLAGHLCERCLDAPAVALAPAPWGGEMGICAACQAVATPSDDTQPWASLPAHVARFRHPNVQEAGHFRTINAEWSQAIFPVCETARPAPRCTCGAYRLVWEGAP